MITKIEPSAIPALWATVKKGVELLCSEKINPERETVGSVYNRLLSNNLTLWEGRKDSKYVGFIITQINQRGLLIYGLYTEKGILPDELIKTHWQDVESYAKQNKCKAIYYYTARWGAMNKRFSGLGFKQVQAIFSMEVA